MELLWNIEDGLHYAEPEELYQEAAKMIKKANAMGRWRDRAARKRLQHKALRYIREAQRTVREEAEYDSRT